MSFTRSTTDLKVHQSLSDYPNVEDGLSAEELKKKFDAPAEQLQKDLNKLVDELEDVGAESIGVKPLTDGDETPPNVYAKLLYLLEQIQNTILAQIPDGTITKAKMNGEYADSLAEKNGELQSNLNAEMLAGNRVNDLLPVYGSYVGDGKKVMYTFANLGFIPKIIEIIEKGASSLDYYGTIITNGQDTGSAYCQRIDGNTGRTLPLSFTEQGIIIGSEDIASFGINSKAAVYDYVIFK